MESWEFVELTLSWQQGFGQTGLDRVGRRWLRHSWSANMQCDKNGAFVPATKACSCKGWIWTNQKKSRGQLFARGLPENDNQLVRQLPTEQPDDRQSQSQKHYSGSTVRRIKMSVRAIKHKLAVGCPHSVIHQPSGFDLTNQDRAGAEISNNCASETAIPNDQVTRPKINSGTFLSTIRITEEKGKEQAVRIDRCSRNITQLRRISALQQRIIRSSDRETRSIIRIYKIKRGLDKSIRYKVNAVRVTCTIGPAEEVRVGVHRRRG